MYVGTYVRARPLVCVCVRERERERGKGREREGGRERGRVGYNEAAGKNSL